MKYLVILLTFISLRSTSQDYKTTLNSFREKYKADFLTDKHSPLKEEDLKNLKFYDGDSTYRVDADVAMLSNQVPFQIPTFSGAKQTYVKYAQLNFTLKGSQYRLFTYQNVSFTSQPALVTYMFLPFTDKTNGNETYAGGRYIDLKTSDIKNGHVEIDFNKAYNPYCAYSAGYQCPMPPAENDLPLKIEAGEKQYGGEKKH